MKIKIKYHTDAIDKLEYVDGKSDWIDLRAARTYLLNPGDFEYIDLGISVQLPKGYEMIIAPRSSSFKKYGILQANSIGVVDESYCGDNDVLMMPVYATKKTVINVNDRICQFRIIKHQPRLNFKEVMRLGNKDRNGFGSTGVQ